VDLLRGLAPTDWQRVVFDPQQGELTLLDVCQLVTQHELAHLSQLRNLIALLPED
jgi:DinB superfamily